MRFIRKNGRIIPIRASAAAGAGLAAGGIAAVAASKKKTKSVKPHLGFKTLSLATNVASGLVSGLTFFSGIKGAALGTGVSIGLDAASAASNVAAFRGRGNRKERLKGLAKSQVVNTAIGWTAFGASLLASKKGREYALKGLRKVLRK